MKKYLFSAMFICLAIGTISAQTALPTPKQNAKTMIAKLGVLNGKATSLPKPVYPPAAAKSGAGGAVTVDVTIDESGDVISAKSDFANELLRNAAIAAAQQAKFAPYTFQGKAVKVTGTLVYNFTAPKDDLFDMSGVGDFLKTYNSTNAFSGIMDVPGQVEDGKYDAAINTLDSLILEKKDDDWALGYRSLAYYYKNDLVHALADANAALAVKPENTRALNVRALVELKKNQPELAKKDFDSAIAISTRAIATRPGSMDDYYYRAQTYRLRGDNEKAAADYRKTLQLTPGYTYAQKHLDEVTSKPPASIATQLTLNSDADAQLKTKFESLITRNNALGAVYDQKNTATMALEASHVTGAKMCQSLAEFKAASDALDPNLNDLINIRDKIGTIASTKQMDGLKAILKWRAEKFIPNKHLIEDHSAANSCPGSAAKDSADLDVVKKFKEHFEEFTRLDPLFETAAGKVDDLEAAIEADNIKNGRTKFAKPADKTAICKALNDLDGLYDDLFSEYYDMNEMKENDELVGHPDFIKFVDEAEKRMDGLGGTVLTKQLLWGCKLPVVTVVK
jgi:TonB family protein